MAIVQDNIASAYLASLDRPLSVPVIDKIDRFAMLQELGFNGQLGFLKANFHGLQDFYNQMAKYSSTNPAILGSAWSTIAPVVMLNQSIAEKLYQDPILGTVGILFRTLPGFGRVFGVVSSDPASIASTVESFT